jgi:hypothetical protein
MSSFVLLYGYSAISKVTTRAEQVQYVEFITSVQSSMGRISSSFGSVDIGYFRLPLKYDEICFTSASSKSDLPFAFIDQYPVLAEAVDSGDNAFLLGKESIFFKVEQLNLPSGFICIPIKNGGLNLKMEGKRNSVRVSPVDTIVVKVSVPEGVTTEDVTVTTSDYSAELEIPAGTDVNYPLGAEENIEVGESDSAPSAGNLNFGGVVYDFKPDGTTFDVKIPITFSYDPNEVADPFELKIYYHDGSNWVVLPGLYDIDVVAHTITGYTDHFTEFTILHKPNYVDCSKFGSDFWCATYDGYNQECNEDVIVHKQSPGCDTGDEGFGYCVKCVAGIVNQQPSSSCDFKFGGSTNVYENPMYCITPDRKITNNPLEATDCIWYVDNGCNPNEDIGCAVYPNDNKPRQDICRVNDCVAGKRKLQKANEKYVWSYFEVCVEQEMDCIDTDGGKDYYVKGDVSGKADSYYADKYDSKSRTSSDICSGASDLPEYSGLLIESYCSEDGIVMTEDYYCPNGCEGGACKELTIVDCNLQILDGICSQSCQQEFNTKKSRYGGVPSDGTILSGIDADCCAQDNNWYYFDGQCSSLYEFWKGTIAINGGVWLDEFNSCVSQNPNWIENGLCVCIDRQDGTSCTLPNTDRELTCEDGACIESTPGDWDSFYDVSTLSLVFFKGAYCLGNGCYEQGCYLSSDIAGIQTIGIFDVCGNQGYECRQGEYKETLSNGCRRYEVEYRTSGQ